MMSRAGRVHGVRGFLVLLLLAAATFAGLAVRNRVHEDRQATRAAGLVQGLLNADTAQVPEFIAEHADYRRWVDRRLRDAFGEAAEGSPQQLHASLALLPVDPGQADYLSNRLLDASPIELPVIWGILKDHITLRVDRFWAVLEDPQADPDHRFRAACALADSDAGQAEKSWDSVSPFIADRFLAAVIKNPGDYSPLIETLRPIRQRLLAPLAVDLPRHRAIRERTDLRHDHPRRLRRRRPRPAGRPAHGRRPEGVPRPSSRSPSGRRRRRFPVFQAELEKKATLDWNDPPLDPILDEARSRPGEPDRSRPRACSTSGSPSARRCRWTSS